MDRRRRLLVNEGEIRTDEALREAAEGIGFRVHAKVRLADALAVDRSGLSTEAYSYALWSHFDWVVADEKSSRPEFAVEFDGESHVEAQARRRDALKDEICARLGLPLLRIDSEAYRPRRGAPSLATSSRRGRDTRRPTGPKTAGKSRPTRSSSRG